MISQKANYTMVLPVRHFRIGDAQVAIESAFAEHLRMMRQRIGSRAEKLLIVAPGLSQTEYEKGSQGYAVIDEQAEQIEFHTLFTDDETLSTNKMMRRLEKVRHLKKIPQVMNTLSKLVKDSFCVHSGLSFNVWLPFEFASIVLAVFGKQRTVFVVDIDYRNSAWMSYRTGNWSLRSYVLCKCVYDVVRSLQIRTAARYCSLVLLKGKQMTANFGSGRPNVKAFLDASHSEKNIIDEVSSARKLQAIVDPTEPLKLVYFGRLTAYKGIDRSLKATAAAKRKGAKVTLDIIGGGEEADSLRNLAHELDADEFVTFHGVMLFNQEFFRLLYKFHLLLAAPLREDTPRSALDAMAAGIPYLAFDTYYYRELLESGAGRIVPWLDVDAMSRALVQLASNREEVARMVKSSIVFARANTQEIWLDRRMAWTMGSGL